MVGIVLGILWERVMAAVHRSIVLDPKWEAHDGNAMQRRCKAETQCRKYRGMMHS